MAVNNQRGQTVVEYILLLAVAMSLIVTFYRSATFQRLFGEQGELGQLYKQEAEWGYRHAHINGRYVESNAPKTSAREHSSYWNNESSETRFFGPKANYP
jgi:hypothetical protein